MPWKIQSVGTSILHQSINHCSVLQLWDLWNVFCMHLNLSQRRAGTLQTSSHYQPALAQPQSLYTEGVCQKLPKWAWVDWKKFTVLRRGQGAWVSPQKGLFAIMGNIHPTKVPDGPWALGSPVEISDWMCEGTGLFSLTSLWWALNPLFYSCALLCLCIAGKGQEAWRKEGSWQVWAFSSLWDVPI